MADKCPYYSLFRVLPYGPDGAIPPAYYTQLYLHFGLASRTNERRVGKFQILEIWENLIESTSTVSPVKGYDTINCSSIYNARNKQMIMEHSFCKISI